MSPTYEARVVILNYNGREILEKCLPSVVHAARRGRRRLKVAVLDNCSRDDSQAYVRASFPEVDWAPAPANKVFCSYNDYVRSAQEPYVILLNNDIRVEEGFADELIDALEADPDAWFAAPRVLHYKTGRYEGGLAKMHVRFGLLWGTALFPGYETRSATPGITMQTGFGAFKRQRFVELGGYDDLYLPGTIEDSDLSFRGWKRGWKGLYRPASVVHHMGQATFKREFGSAGIRRLNRRNIYLFMWKNISDPLILAGHLLCVPLHLLRDTLSGRREFVAAFFDALGLLSQALTRRRRTLSVPCVMTDRAVFAVSRSL